MTMRVVQALVAAACVLCGTLAHAQGARSQFNGTVTDSGGGVLVGATVVATNVETNVESKSTTTDAGVYVIPYLANGVYRFSVSAPGFRPAEANRCHPPRRTDADARLQARRGCDQGGPERPGAGHRDQHGRDRPYVTNKEFQTWPIAVGDGQRQIQQFIFSSLPGTDRQYVRGRDQRRPQLLARDPHRRHAARPEPAGRQQQRDVAADGSHRGVQVPDRYARRRVRRRADGGGQLRRQVRDEPVPRVGRGVPDGWKWDARPFVAKALNQPTPVRNQQNGAVAIGGPIILPKLFNGRNRSFFFTTFEKTRARGADVHRVPHAAHPRVPERRLLAALRRRLHQRCALGHGHRHRCARPPIFASARSTTRARPAS